MIDREQIENWEYQLPEWAKGRANGDYTFPNASLPTRDGRKTGNAVMLGMATRQLDPKQVTYLIVTDAGNILRVNINELKELFHPPEWVMRDLLYAHVKALLEEELNHG